MANQVLKKGDTVIIVCIGEDPSCPQRFHGKGGVVVDDSSMTKFDIAIMYEGIWEIGEKNLMKVPSL